MFSNIKNKTKQNKKHLWTPFSENMKKVEVKRKFSYPGLFPLGIIL